MPEVERYRFAEVKSAAEKNDWRLEFAVIRRSARTVFLATHALSMVVESSLRKRNWPQAYLNKDCDLFLSPELATQKKKLTAPDKPTLGSAVLVSEISGVAGVPFEAAKRLSQWIFYAARQHNHLFLELDSHPVGELVGLSLTPYMVENLYSRWAIAEDEEPPSPEEVTPSSFGAS